MCFTRVCKAGRAGFTPEHCCTTDGLLQCPARRSIRMCPEHQPSIHAQGCAEARGQKESMALPPMAYLFSWHIGEVDVGGEYLRRRCRPPIRWSRRYSTDIGGSRPCADFMTFCICVYSKQHVLLAVCAGSATQASVSAVLPCKQRRGQLGQI